jgi:hypothetical protein
MTRLLGIALEHEVEAATRGVIAAVNQVDAECSKRGITRSGAHIIMTINAYAEAVKNLTPAAFAQALAVHEKAGVSDGEAREAAIKAVRGFVESLRGKVEGVCERSGARGSALQAAIPRFAEIDADFAREAELYRAGVDRGHSPSASITHNSVSITGDGNTLIAQQGTSYSTQNVQQTNAVLKRLSAAIDDQPLTGPARREVEAIVDELKAEAAKPAPVKGRIAELLGNVSTALGIAKTAPEVVKAIADVTQALGLGA